MYTMETPILETPTAAPILYPPGLGGCLAFRGTS